jgi:O-antigen ligase
MLSWVIRGKIEFTRTPLDVPLLIFTAVIVISTIFSETRYSSIYGSFPRVHGSAVSWIVYILLYFVTVSNIKSASQIRNLLYVLITSASLVSAITLMSFFNLYLPFDFSNSPNFTPTGSSFSTSALLILLVPVPLLSLLNPGKYFPVSISIALASLFGITVVLTGGMLNIIALAAAVALSFFVTKPEAIKKSFIYFAVPCAIIFGVLALTYLPVPGNPISTKVANFPKEVQLPFDSSWKIAASALRESPVIGTGPSTFLYNFTNYKPGEFNLSRFWSVPFDTSHNELFQVISTLGFAGFFALLFLFVVILNRVRKNLTQPHGEDSSDRFLAPSLAVSGILVVGLMLIHVTTLVSSVVSILVLAMLAASQKSVRDHVAEHTAANKQFNILPYIVLVIFLIGGGYILFMTYNAALADYYHREALSQVSRNGSLTYKYLQQAESLNPYIDLYRVDMAQTNFALANAIAVQKGPTENSPQGTLTDQDRRTIQTLLAQAISEGKAAAALNPRSARNWEVLGSIYRNITGVAENALDFALDAYGKAIQQDPLNPVLRLNVGGIYYSVKNYDLAVRFFSDAINLKPDYSNAYYNLAIALRDKGDLQNATVVAERMITLLANDSEDYKTGTALLEELKNRSASGQTAPAGQTNSALGNNLPDVNVNLNHPPEAATPSAVRNISNPLPVTPTPLP